MLVAEQLGLERQTWREMESIACARIALARARGDFGAARHLARRLRDTAQARGLKRTLLRCLAEWMVLEYQARETASAISRLKEFLRRFSTTDYSRPLARYPDVSVRVLELLLGSDTESDIRSHAENLYHEVGKGTVESDFRVSRYSAQELNVLQGLVLGQRDKEIARRVGLTENGVRYHLKKIYRKMGVNRKVRGHCLA